MAETDSGILTRKQRKWLRGDNGDVSPQQAANYRAAVKARLRNALREDFAIINREIAHEDIVEAVEDRELTEDDVEGTPVLEDGNLRVIPPWIDPDTRPERAEEVLGEQKHARIDPEILENYVEIVVFLYRVSGGFGGLRHNVKEGVGEIYRRFHPDRTLRSVEFRWDAEFDFKLVRSGEQKMQRGEPLTSAERDALMDSDKYTAEDIGRYVDEHPRERDMPPSGKTLADAVPTPASRDDE